MASAAAMAHTTQTGENAAGHGCQLQAVLDAHGLGTKHNQHSVRKRHERSGLGERSEWRGPGTAYTYTTSDKEKCKRLDRHAASQRWLQRRPWPTKPKPAKMPPAMGVRCKPCWAIDSGMALGEPIAIRMATPDDCHLRVPQHDAGSCHECRPL